MNPSNSLPNYRIYDLTGGGVTHDIYAETIDDAIEAGREWIEDGDWGESTKATRLDCEVGPIIRVILNEDGFYVDIDGREWVKSPESGCRDLVNKDDPDETFVINRRLAKVGDIDLDATDAANREDCSGVCPVTPPPDCSDGDPDSHDWQSPYSVLGGCKENPGVWGSQHGGVWYKEICKHCGLYRITDTGATDSSNGMRCESVEYEDADEASLNYIWGDESEWTQWVKDHTDGEVMDGDDLESAFRAIFRRASEDQERVEGLWSHLNAYVSRD